MRKMLFVQTGEKDVLQLATSSLDASTKVYSIRVDDVHSDGMKLASSMARAVTTEVDEGEFSIAIAIHKLHANP